MLIFQWCVVTDWFWYALTTTVHNRLLFSAKIRHRKLPSMPEMQYNTLHPFYFTSVSLPALALQQRNGGIFYDTDRLGKLQSGDHCVSLAQSAPRHLFSFTRNSCIHSCLHCLIMSGVRKFPLLFLLLLMLSPCPLFSFFIPLFFIHTSTHTYISIHIWLPSSLFRWLLGCR